MIKWFSSSLAAIALSVSGAGRACAGVDFAKEIKPILEQSCLKCHSGQKPKGGLNLETKEKMLAGGDDGAVLMAGKAGDSKLYLTIIAPKDDDNKMPPEGERLPKAATDKVKAWIDEGANWPEGVVLKAPAKEITKTEVDDHGLPITPAEKSAVEKLEKAGVFVMRLAQNTNYLRVDFTHRGKEVKDDELMALKEMPNLVELSLGGMNISDAQILHLKPLNNLSRLQLQRTKITDAGLAHLAGLTKLVSLNLYGTDVTDNGIQHLKNLRALKRLYVWQTKVTEEGAKQLAAAIPGIDINRGYELPPEPKKEEPKKEQPKAEPKKEEPKKKDPQTEPKKEGPKKEQPKAEPKNEPEPKKEPPKQEAAPKPNVKNDEPKDKK